MRMAGEENGHPAKRGEAAALALFCVASICFVAIAIAVHSDWLVAFERSVLLSFRTADDLAVPLGPHGLISFVRDVTALGSFAVLAGTVLAVAGFLALSGHRNRALATLGYALGGTLLGEAAKHVFARTRPDVVPHIVEVVTLSFPSAHAMQATVVWLTLAVLLAGVQPRTCVKIYLVAVAAVLIAAVGISRIYLGVHWPTDVLAGWSLGLAWVMGCWLIDQRFARPKP